MPAVSRDLQAFLLMTHLSGAPVMPEESLLVALTGADGRGVRFNWLPTQNDAGRISSNRRLHYVREQLGIPDWEPVLKAAFKSLLDSGILVRALTRRVLLQLT